MIRSRFASLLSLPAATAITACVTTSSPIPLPPPLSLVGDWSMVAVNGRQSGGGATIRPPIYRIGFGCNNGRAIARVEQDRLIIVGPFGSTERGCDPHLEKREDEGFRIAARTMRIVFYGRTECVFRTRLEQ